MSGKDKSTSVEDTSIPEVEISFKNLNNSEDTIEPQEELSNETVIILESSAKEDTDASEIIIDLSDINSGLTIDLENTKKDIESRVVVEDFTFEETTETNSNKNADSIDNNQRKLISEVEDSTIEETTTQTSEMEESTIEEYTTETSETEESTIEEYTTETSETEESAIEYTTETSEIKYSTNKETTTRKNNSNFSFDNSNQEKENIEKNKEISDLVQETYETEENEEALRYETIVAFSPLFIETINNWNKQSVLVNHIDSAANTYIESKKTNDLSLNKPVKTKTDEE